MGRKNYHIRKFDIILGMLFLSIILKDFFKIITYFEVPNINYLLLIIYPFVVISIFRFKDEIIKFDVVGISFVLFYVWCLLSIVINFIFENRYGYDLSNLFIALFFYCVLPLILLLVVVSCPKDYERMVGKVVIPVGCVVIFLTIGTFVVYLISPESVINFFVGLMKDDLIVNPIQSTSNEIQLRFSGIFYSSFTYALFCNFCFFYILYSSVYSKKNKFLLCSGFLVLVFLSLNRNGYVVFLFMVMFYFAKRIIIYKSNRILTIAISFVFAWLALAIPLLLLAVDTSGGFTSVDSLYFKISTLFSRVNAWSDYFNSVPWLDVILGNGFVQGLGDTKFFLDNSYYHVIATGGVGLFLLLIFIIISTSGLLIASKFNNSEQFVFSFSLFASGLLSMFINNSLFEPIFLLLYVFYPLSMAYKSKSLNMSCNFERSFKS